MIFKDITLQIEQRDLAILTKNHSIPERFNRAYVIHYKKLVERKTYLTAALTSQGIAPVFIDSYDRGTVDPALVSRIYPNTPTMWNTRIEGIYSDPPAFRPLSMAEICNALSHLDALKAIVSGTEPYGLILEDDVVFGKHFAKQMFQRMNETPEGFDVLFLGDSFSLKALDIAMLGATPIRRRLGKHVYRRTPPATRCVDGFIISRAFASKLLAEIRQIALPFDFELNYFFKVLNPLVYWCVPGILKQGSQTGIYASSIR